MNLQPFFILIFAGFLLSTKAISASPNSLAVDTTEFPAHFASRARTQIPQVLFKPSGTGRPPTTRGAGSRNDRICAQDIPANSGREFAKSPALTALIPSSQSNFTQAERPTFWVYLPKTSARQLVLSIQDADSQPHSQRFFPITGERGIVGIPMAENSPPLETGKFYQWAVVMVCGDRPHPNDPVVTAWVQRVPTFQTLSKQQTKPQTILEQAAHYGEQGVWYDALTTLATARRSQPQDPTLAKVWTDFLAQPTVELGAIANESLP